MFKKKLHIFSPWLIPLAVLFLLIFFLIGYFLYLHFKCFLLSRSPLWKPPIPSALPLLYEGAPSLIHSCPPALEFSYTGAYTFQDQGPLLPMMAD